MKTKNTSDTICFERCVQSTLLFVLDDLKNADEIGELLINFCDGRQSGKCGLFHCLIMRLEEHTSSNKYLSGLCSIHYAHHNRQHESRAAKARSIPLFCCNFTMGTFCRYEDFGVTWIFKCCYVQSLGDVIQLFFSCSHVLTSLDTAHRPYFCPLSSHVWAQQLKMTFSKLAEVQRSMSSAVGWAISL